MSADKLAQATTEDDPTALWAEIWRLRAAVKGPDGHETWQDAATAERLRRVKAEAALAAHEAAPQQAQLEKERAARQEAQSELARYKGLLASSRLDLMREMKEQGWTAPQQGSKT